MQDSVIDWKLALELAGNNRDFAKEMLLLLVKNLASDLVEIKKHCAANSIKELTIQLHKLHGALCYCGAPRLKYATTTFEQALKDKKYSEIPALLAKFELEANELIEQVTSPTFQ